MITEKSCGGIIFKEENGKRLWLVVSPKRTDGEFWVFPKGHVKEGETEKETAVREIYEEVGLKIERRGEFRESSKYMLPNGNEKEVVYFLFRAVTTDVKYVLDEIVEHFWLPFDKAMKKLSFEDNKNMLKKAGDIIS